MFKNVQTFVNPNTLKSAVLKILNRERANDSQASTLQNTCGSYDTGKKLHCLWGPRDYTGHDRQRKPSIPVSALKDKIKLRTCKKKNQ